MGIFGLLLLNYVIFYILLFDLLNWTSKACICTTTSITEQEDYVMSAVFEEVYLLDYDDDSLCFRKRNTAHSLTLEVIDESDKLLIRSKNHGSGGDSGEFFAGIF